MDATKIYAEVGQRYSRAAQTESGAYGEMIAKSFGYSVEQLAGVTGGSNLGLSCGNPLALASLREGETVVDLGSGAGFDVFLAADAVGPTGKAIGVDMNKDMLARAIQIKEKNKKGNVEFVESKITNMTELSSGIADCIISNCVVNLVPEEEKHLVFREIHRLLKPGGRVAISDILAKKPLPEKMRSDIALYVGCIAGASLVAEYESYLRGAGFQDVLITDTGADLNVYFDGGGESEEQPAGVGTSSCCDGQANKKLGTCETGTPGSCRPVAVSSLGAPSNDLNEWVGSFKIYATKLT